MENKSLKENNAKELRLSKELFKIGHAYPLLML